MQSAQRRILSARVTAMRLAARGGNAYLLLMSSKQHRGLSTAFGWRLTPLKMTENSELVAEKAVTALSALSAVWIPS
jgi:hypothetical protein